MPFVNVVAYAERMHDRKDLCATVILALRRFKVLKQPGHGGMSIAVANRCLRAKDRVQPALREHRGQRHPRRDGLQREAWRQIKREFVLSPGYVEAALAPQHIGWLYT